MCNILDHAHPYSLTDEALVMQGERTAANTGSGLQVWKIAGQTSRLFQVFKTLYEPCKQPLVKQKRKGDERDKWYSGSNGMNVTRFRDDLSVCRQIAE